MKSIYGLTVLILVTFPVRAFAIPETPPVPSDWVVAHDSETENSPEDLGAEPEAPNLARETSNLFSAQATSLETLPSPSEGKWKVAAVMTDLAISASGWIGFLVQKGTPSVTTVWRRQMPKVADESPTFSSEENSADLVILEPQTRAELDRSLEPTIRALLANGTIQGESALRRNLVTAAEDFQSLASRLSAVSAGGPWWISRLRLDFSVDASGSVTPVIGIGAEAKVRFEWHRLVRKNINSNTEEKRAPVLASGISNNLAIFAEGLVEDLSDLTDGTKEVVEGFRASGFRVGLGISAKGDVGIAKAATTLVGHLYFSRNLSPGVAAPKPSLLESPVLLMGEKDGVILPRKLDRKTFRRGLRKSLRMGRFFARRAAHTQGKWKIRELRTGFELSFGGKTGISRVGGIAATEITFLNTGF